MRKFRNKQTGIILVPNNKMVVEQLAKNELYEEVKEKATKETSKGAKATKETSENENNE